jgi:hypothetical protein
MAVFFQKYSLGFGIYWPPHGNNFRHPHTLTHVVTRIFVSTAAEGNTHTHTHTYIHTYIHTRRKCTHTLSLSLSASLVLTAHFYSDHSFLTMLLSGGFQSSPYASGLQSPLLVFDAPSFHFILLLCVCVRPSYVCLFIFISAENNLRFYASTSVDVPSELRQLSVRSPRYEAAIHVRLSQLFLFPITSPPHFLQCHITTCPYTERKAGSA